MKRLLALLCGAAVSVPAMAADWQVFTEREGTTGYYDRASVKKNKGTARLWVMWDSSQTRDAAGVLHMSTRELLEVDCEQERFRFLAWMAYAGRAGGGELLKTINLEPGEAPWNYIAPGTSGMSILGAACGKK